MDLIFVAQYVSSRDPHSRAVFVSGREVTAATSFTAVMSMDRAYLLSLIQKYDFV